MRIRRKQLICLFIIAATLTFLRHSSQLLWGQTSASQSIFSSGKEFMVPQKEVNGKLIGQEDALLQESVVTDLGRRYLRVDVGVTGTLEGWVVKEGPRGNHFTSEPGFAFTQTGNEYPRFHGTLRYQASRGTAMTIIYPEGGTGWNGKLFIMVHGSGGSFLGETLKPWNQNFKRSQPWEDISKYERLMLDKGYAIAKTRRNAGSPGDYAVTLDDGEILQGRNLNVHTGLILGMVQLAENLLQARLGEKPSRTYWYGHSGGGMKGRMVNYLPGVNRNENGEPIIDGFLNDDSGGGRYLPILEKNGRDTLLLTEKERQQFAKTIEISHQLYNGRLNVPSVPPWMSQVYLINKRLNAQVLQEKGLGEKIRMYEVRGISHQGGEYLEEGRDGDIVVLDLSRIMDSLIDLLDNWVEKDSVPPPTKSDWLELGDTDGDGKIENEAIAMPELACPLGMFFQFPPSMEEGGSGWTGFAPFDGQSLEPQDGRGVFVDMNLNRYQDHRESVEEAWHRLGLLKPAEKFTRAKYQACVEASVAKLQQERFFTEQVASLYIQQASETDFPGQ